ncbi:MAG: N-acetyltransferase [Candidatus Zixiibacteriota bacterium]|nr:MAG: N-acetyltransferase [candidate division Zixibacteria bacterium]
MDYTLSTLADRPGLLPALEPLSRRCWPEFLLHGDVTLWHELWVTFPECQILLTGSDDALLAVGHTVPLLWDGSLNDLPERIEDILSRALEARQRGDSPNAFSALAALVHPSFRGQGLSSAVIREMKALAARQGAGTLIAPVRPVWKDRYPLTPLDRYAAWTRPDGLPYDPWIRVHIRLGGRVLAVAPNTLAVTGTVAQWETWTGMVFPDSGPYVVPGALQPVIIDRDRDLGRYEDPNLWMAHAV